MPMFTRLFLRSCTLLLSACGLGEASKTATTLPTISNVPSLPSHSYPYRLFM